MAGSQLLGQSQATDETLACQGRAESAAFEELYCRHATRVLRYHFVRTGNMADAQDLTARTFLAAYEGLASYSGGTAFVAWLLGIARHKVADYFRERKTYLPLEAVAKVPHSTPPLEDDVIAQLNVDRLRHAIGRLSPDRAEALVLRFFAGLSAAEAGLVMARSDAAVKMLVYRGLRDLRRLLIIHGQE